MSANHGVFSLSLLGFLAMIVTGGALQTVRARAADAAPVALNPVLDCGQLAQADVSSVVGAKTTISSASPVLGEPTPYCRVMGNISPSVKFELRLPLVHWTQRFVQTGCGGLCGELNIRLGNAGTCVPARRGEFALASTDMGHSGPGAQWGENYAARIDFAYRGVHVTAVAAKALIAKFYGHKPKYSYFAGCSDGGREALMEAQRYPHDFDGITAGAPAMNFTTQNTFYHGWNARMNMDSSGRAILTADRLPILHQAALNQCDAADGLKDGLISDPVNCHVDVAAVECPKEAGDVNCLSAAQVHVAEEIYRGAHDASGKKLVISGPLPGSELNWAGVYVPAPGENRFMSSMISEGTMKYLAYDPNPSSSFKLADFKFNAENFAATTRLHGLYDATDPDLSRFATSGGKLILWHGLADPHISPLNTVAYYRAMQKTLGAAKVDEFTRLFLFPGGGHCGGGEGPFDMDMMSAIMAWVESAKAPDVVIASHSTPGPPAAMIPGAPSARPPVAAAPAHVDRSRPIYPFPKVAQYAGHGSIDDPANFKPTLPDNAWPTTFAWLGEAFYAPNSQQWCTASAAHADCRRMP